MQSQTVHILVVTPVHARSSLLFGFMIYKDKFNVRYVSQFVVEVHVLRQPFSTIVLHYLGKSRDGPDTPIYVINTLQKVKYLRADKL